jgi:hypothetical protein
MRRQGLAQHSKISILIHNFTCSICIDAFSLPIEIMPFITSVRYRLCIRRSVWRSLNPDVKKVTNPKSSVTSQLPSPISQISILSYLPAPISNSKYPRPHRRPRSGFAARLLSIPHGLIDGLRKVVDVMGIQPCH